jgi:hypothetical protein
MENGKWKMDIGKILPSLTVNAPSSKAKSFKCSPEPDTFSKSELVEEHASGYCSVCQAVVNPGLWNLHVKGKKHLGRLAADTRMGKVPQSVLGAKSTSIRDCVSRLVGPLVGPSVPTMQLRGKLVMSRLLREEEEVEENWLRRDSFAPRD